MNDKRNRLLTLIGPGILVAATGVGAGDLATGALAGQNVGLVILWAVLVGAGLKFLLSEGLARWQLATGDTLLEGAVRHLGAPARWVFLFYLITWSFLVAVALMSACGVTALAIRPLFSPGTDKIVYGVAHSVVAVGLVRMGGYRLFAKIMSVCIAVMFTVVIAIGVALVSDWSVVLRGLVVPTIPPASTGAAAGADPVVWTVGLLGGVGGTLTILCYGYWIREEGRRGAGALRLCRIDLATGYVMTALFGLSMVVIGDYVGAVEDKGAQLIVNVAGALETAPELRVLGPVAKWAFLVGAWGAVFSSLLGVWQSVPYLFADFWRLTRHRRGDDVPSDVDTRSRPYRLYLYALATVPAVALPIAFSKLQLAYAVVGALFVPLMVPVLLVLNGRTRLVGARYRNSWLTTVLLAGTLVFFLYFGWLKIR